MDLTLKKLNDVLGQMPGHRALIVALSGGMDSMVLLHCLQQLRQQGSLAADLGAIHVNHGLQAEADQWQRFCEQQCQQLGVPLQSRRLQLLADNTKPGNLAGSSEESRKESGKGSRKESTQAPGNQVSEAQARDARYGVFEELLGRDELLLLAHHRDDQLETLLLRLMRGSGVGGLAGMPRSRSLGKGQLYRPLLDFDRSTLFQFAQAQGVDWIQDLSNKDLSFDRNYLRQQLLPLIEQRWPGYRESWSKSQTLLAEADELLADLAQRDLAAVRGCQANMLQIKLLNQLGDARRRNLIRRWFFELGLREPGWSMLQQVCSEILTAEVDAQPSLKLQGHLLQRHRDTLYLLREQSAPGPITELNWAAQEQQRLLLSNNGSLVAELIPGQGIRPNVGTLSIRYRHGGESLRLPGRPQKSLKKLMQEAGLEPWLRDRTPLLYREEELVCIPGIGVAEAYVAKTPESGLVIRWDAPSFAPFAVPACLEKDNADGAS